MFWLLLVNADNFSAQDAQGVQFSIHQTLSACFTLLEKHFGATSRFTHD